MEFPGKMPPLAQPGRDSNRVMPEIVDRGWQMKVSVPSPPPAAEQSAPSGSRLITPTLLFVIVILAVVFFVSGLLHLLIRLLVKQRSRRRSSSAAGDEAGEVSDSEAIQRQLQQLFHLHDSGLDQAFIDALPIFLYRELVGAKEPFDCAVCLCEFSAEDKLRLLPVCSHAFHLDCIDTWLLSNSTCPLCRGTLFVPGLAMENPIFDLEEAGEEGLAAARDGAEEGADEGKMVFSVRLGKFRSLHQGGDKAKGEELRGAGRGSEVGSSSSSLDRRCYSMGSYKYVVGESTLQVALSTVGRRRRSGRGGGASGGGGGGMGEGMEGRRLCVAGKGESFSVSKIWQWSSRGGKYPMASDEASLSPWRVRGRGGGSSKFGGVHDNP